MKNLMLMTAALGLHSMVALAAETGTGSSKPAKGETGAKDATGTPAAEQKVFGARTDIQMPDFTSGRGRGSQYDFDGLQVGQSFGVKGLKDATSLNSSISNAHTKHRVIKTDAAGNQVNKQTPIKDAEGKITGYSDSGKPDYVKGREFRAANVDPKTDPDGANVRVWRTK